MFEPANNLESLLNGEVLRRSVDAWLAEDMPPFDFGGSVLPRNGVARAELRCKTAGSVVLCGRPFLATIFDRFGVSVHWRYVDGDVIETAADGYTVVADLTSTSGSQSILLAERNALNVLTRAAGIATLARRYVQRAEQHNWAGTVAATRKTTPGFRIAEKYAAIVGGADAHRYDLSTMVMLKDNHISAFGNDITKLVQEVKKRSGFTPKIEVESRDEDEAFRAAAAGADIVMLDNFSPAGCTATATKLKRQYPQLIIEASGGITFDNIAEYFSDALDVISTSVLTQGYPTVDFSLKIQT